MILAFTLGLVLGSILTFLSISLFLVNRDIHECDRKTKEINEDIKESIKKYLHERGQ